jgi:hypothetical protein
MMAIILSFVPLLKASAAKTYTITFNSNEGTPLSPIIILSGGKVTSRNLKTTREGFVLGGWYKDNTTFKQPCNLGGWPGDTKHDSWSTPVTTIYKDTTLYARWLKIVDVTFRSNNDDKSSASQSSLNYSSKLNSSTSNSGSENTGASSKSNSILSISSEYKDGTLSKIETNSLLSSEVKLNSKINSEVQTGKKSSLFGIVFFSCSFVIAILGVVTILFLKNKAMWIFK